MKLDLTVEKDGGARCRVTVPVAGFDAAFARDAREHRAEYDAIPTWQRVLTAMVGTKIFYVPGLRIRAIYQDNAKNPCEGSGTGHPQFKEAKP